MTTPPPAPGPYGPDLIDLTARIAQALGPGWAHGYTMPGGPEQEPTDTAPTRTHLTLVSGPWRLGVDGAHPATPGRCSIWVEDQTDPWYHDKIDWDALPAGSGTLVVNASDPASALAEAIDDRLLTNAARARQYELHEAKAAAASRHGSIEGTLIALTYSIETAYDHHTQQGYTKLLGDLGTMTPKVVADDEGGEPELRVAGLDGFTMRLGNPGRVRISMRDRYVDVQTAALIAVLLKRSHDNET